MQTVALQSCVLKVFTCVDAKRYAFGAERRFRDGRRAPRADGETAGQRDSRGRRHPARRGRPRGARCQSWRICRWPQRSAAATESHQTISAYGWPCLAVQSQHLSSKGMSLYRFCLADLGSRAAGVWQERSRPFANERAPTRHEPCGSERARDDVCFSFFTL